MIVVFMIHLVDVVVRVLAGIAGVLFVYAAVFLYEDEQGKLQNRLEQWWIEISDREKTATSRYAVFMQEVARVAAGLFDRLLGAKLFSWRALKVSVVFSMGSYLLFMTFDTIRDEGLTKGDLKSLLVQPLFAAALFWYGSHRLTIRQPFRFLTHFFAVSILVAMFSGFVINYGNAGLLAIGSSLLCDIAFIAITRQTLRWCSQMERLVPVVLVILINCLIAVVFLIGPAALSYAHSQMLINPRPEELQRADWITAGAVFAGLNTVDALAASVFVILALIAITHRVLWPVLGRVLYALQGIGIARRRNLMATLGILLLTHAGLNMPEQLKKVVGIFSG
jgi:hypothetical protein